MLDHHPPSLWCSYLKFFSTSLTWSIEVRKVALLILFVLPPFYTSPILFVTLRESPTISMDCALRLHRYKLHLTSVIYESCAHRKWHVQVHFPTTSLLHIIISNLDRATCFFQGQTSMRQMRSTASISSHTDLNLIDMQKLWSIILHFKRNKTIGANLDSNQVYVNEGRQK